MSHAAEAATTRHINSIIKSRFLLSFYPKFLNLPDKDGSNHLHPLINPRYNADSGITDRFKSLLLHFGKVQIPLGAEYAKMRGRTSS